MSDLTTYELAKLRLQAFGLLDDWGAVDEKGRHVPHTLERRKDVADDLVEWAISDRVEIHGLDTDRQVFFYEQEFYVLSNFSAFRIFWRDRFFDTSEHAYHFERFLGADNRHRVAVMSATSAHDAFRYAQDNKQHQRPNWNETKAEAMRGILRAKAEQHEYVRRKLLETGNRELVENSWRDDYWGWGPYRDGKNMLGQLWMEIRSEYRALAQQPPAGETKG